MTPLPQVASVPAPVRTRHISWVHYGRAVLVVLVLLGIRLRNTPTPVGGVLNFATRPEIEDWVTQAVPGVESIGEPLRDGTGNWLLDARQEPMGRLIQTSPVADDLVGYVGPTNCLIATDAAGRILAARVLESRDTVEHVERVRNSVPFWRQLVGLGGDTDAAWETVDVVSGATLTSHAVLSGIARRLGSGQLSLKFPDPPRLEVTRQLLPAAAALVPSDREGIWTVEDSAGTAIGSVLLTGPASEGLSGYQGPTSAQVVLDPEGKVIGVRVDRTFDSSRYAHYLDDDRFFQKWFVGMTLEELQAIDPEQTEWEGVSGATMTSRNVIRGMGVAARAVVPVQSGGAKRTRSWQSYWPDGVTAGLILLGLGFVFRDWSRHRLPRWFFQCAVILVLGVWLGRMISQALLVGWAQHGIPWRSAPGLVALVIAAFAVPVFSRQQLYCSQLCPFGAIQQWTRHAPVPKWHVKGRVKDWLRRIPALLLALVIASVIVPGNWNLAALEPFDAFAWNVAGWATLAVFAAGLLFSLFVPMGYCHYGCPTGVTLQYVKQRRDSGTLQWRDGYVVLLCLAVWLI